jgi:hypothetical protein
MSIDMFVDSNGNRVSVVASGRTLDRLPVLVVTLADTPNRGYLALEEPRGGFGDSACPSSYGRPCMTWFGPGERYPDARAALSAVCGR